MNNGVSKTEASLTFASDKYDPAKYARVAEDARLREVRLVKSDFFIKVGSFLTNQIDEEADLHPSYEGEPGDFQYSESAGFLAGYYKWTADIKAGRKKVLKASAEYLVAYGNLGNADEDYARLYFLKLARFTTYPYFRSHFAGLVANAGVTLPPLPSLFDRID